MSVQLGQTIINILKSNNIPYISLQQQPYSFLSRFEHTEDQLRTQDLIQASLGSNYTVALNLADRTPHWLHSIGAKPMKLGLDLRGGIHFLLQVDAAAMLKEQQSSDMHNMGMALRQAKIRYAGLSTSSSGEIGIQFRDKTALDQALTLLKKDYPDYQFNVTNQDNLIRASLSKSAQQKTEEYAVTQNIGILSNKINELGVSEPVIQQQGKNQISVDLPGIQDAARAKAIIGKVATIRLQMVDMEHDAAEAARTGVIPVGFSLYFYESRPILLKNEIVLRGRSILNASSVTDENGRPSVSVRVGGSDVSLFNQITRENIGKPMATVYLEVESVKKMVNGKVVMEHKQSAKIINIATIQSALGTNFQITGLDSARYAQDLALQLRSGAYLAPVNFIQERLVGPSLGKENIRQGVLSLEVGTLLVVLFMVLYYRLFGLFADLALILNTVFIVAIMSLLEATLTLPGIAGIVLTVGMAVDANVLINERIREELRNGLSPQASIHAGYARAFSTIVDSNVTTLIVAVILFILGTGSVQSFAITLSIGLLTSMVTAIFFTRALVNLTYGRRTVKRLSIGIAYPLKTVK